MEFNESEFLVETIVPEDELIISRTDLKGLITYANEVFTKMVNLLSLNLKELQLITKRN